MTDAKMIEATVEMMRRLGIVRLHDGDRQKTHQENKNLFHLDCLETRSHIASLFTLSPPGGSIQATHWPQA